MKAASQLSQRVMQNTNSDAARRLAAELVHDFNNILNVISGYLQLMQENPNSPDRMAAYLAKAQKVVQESSSMTSELLASNLTSGSSESTGSHFASSDGAPESAKRP